MSIRIISLISIILLLSACTKVGSDAWCEKKKEQPKGEWTVDETSDYAKFCVLGLDSEK